MLNQSNTCHYLVVPHVPNWRGLLTWVGSTVQMWSWFNGSDYVEILHITKSGFLWMILLVISNSRSPKIQQGVRSTVHTLDDSTVQISSWFRTSWFQHSWRESSWQLHLLVCETPKWSHLNFSAFRTLQLWDSCCESPWHLQLSVSEPPVWSLWHFAISHFSTSGLL